MPPRKNILKAVPDRKPERAPDLREHLKATLTEMTWLTPSDKALVALALRVAEEIETAADRAAELDDLRRETAGDESLFKRLQRLEAQCDVTRAVRDLGPQLQSLLKDLGGTPGARAALKVERPVKGRLADLRASARQHDT